LNATVSEYITIARRKKTDWYVGTITNHEERNITIPLNFLEAGEYRVELFTDANDVSENPNHLVKHVEKLSNTDTIHVKVAGGGGMVMRITKK
jgi:alpha-glucosidase